MKKTPTMTGKRFLTSVPRGLSGYLVVTKTTLTTEKENVSKTVAVSSTTKKPSTKP